MNIQILQENLLKALTRTGRILSSKPQLPVAQNALLQTKTGGLRVVTTNLETTEAVSVGAKVEQEGTACVSSRLLTELVLTLPPETVRLETKDEGVIVRCSGYQAEVPGVSPKEFPPAPEHAGIKKQKTKKEDLVRALSLVLFAAATDEGRPILTGVKFFGDQKGTTIVATDGYRLSLKKTGRENQEPLDMTVPARALFEMVKTAIEEKDVAEISFGKTESGQLAFVVGDTEITTRIIDGDYPDVFKIIPTSFTTRALFDKDSLTRAVKSAAVFARDNANIVRFVIENQTLVVSAQSAQTGKNQVEMSAKVDGDGGEIAFNSRFLLDFLNNFPEPEVLFEMTGSLNPGVFRPVKDDSYLHIIMPVRVQG